MLGICALLVGPLSDKIGRRKILLLEAFMSLFLLMHSMANTFLSLLLLRAASGMAGGVLVMLQ